MILDIAPHLPKRYIALVCPTINESKTYFDHWTEEVTA